jgi:hypothetical protein
VVKHEQDVLVVPVALVVAVLVLSLELLWHFKNINPINTELYKNWHLIFLKMMIQQVRTKYEMKLKH